MKYSEMFSDSDQMYPNGGARLSPTACGFILPEMESLCKRYTKELETMDPEDSAYRRMMEAHLEGLTSITAQIEAGMTNKPTT